MSANAPRPDSLEVSTDEMERLAFEQQLAGGVNMGPVWATAKTTAGERLHAWLGPRQ